MQKIIYGCLQKKQKMSEHYDWKLHKGFIQKTIEDYL